MAPKKQKRPRRGIYPIGTLVADLTGQAFKRYGFSRAALVVRWPDIVGAELARMTTPERLIRPTGTLTLRATTEGAVEAQHMSDRIIASVNDFYGYDAVQRIKIRQAPFAQPLSNTKPAPRVDTKPPLPNPASRLDAALARLKPASRH